MVTGRDRNLQVAMACLQLLITILDSRGIQTVLRMGSAFLFASLAYLLVQIIFLVLVLVRPKVGAICILIFHGLIVLSAAFRLFLLDKPMFSATSPLDALSFYASFAIIIICFYYLRFQQQVRRES